MVRRVNECGGVKVVAGYWLWRVNSREGAIASVEWRKSIVRACPEIIGTNREEHYLPHELALIAYGKRKDLVYPEITSAYWKRKKKCCIPLTSLGGPNGPTEREKIAYRLM